MMRREEEDDSWLKVEDEGIIPVSCNRGNNPALFSVSGLIWDAAPCEYGLTRVVIWDGGNGAEGCFFFEEELRAVEMSVRL